MIAYISTDRNLETGKSNPSLNLNQKTHILNIYDLKKDRILTQMKFHNDIETFNISYKKLYVVLETEIFVFELFSFNNTHYFETKPNPYGIFANSINDDIIVFPGNKKYFIKIKNLETQTVFDFNFEENYQSFFMNKSASILAVVNQNGNTIKLIDLESLMVIKTLKRGMGDALICNISFSETDDYMAASSNKGTVHIWKIMEEEGNETKPKTGHRIFHKVTGKLFSSGEKSFVKLHLKENYSFVGFVGKTNNVFIIAESGKLYMAEGKDDNFKINKTLTLLN